MPAQIDWQAVENYFITKTSASMFYREFADLVTPTLVETNYTFINYETIKARGKAGYWVQRRAQHLVESNPGLYADDEVVYGLIMDALLEKDLTPRDIAQLSRERRELASVLRSRDAILSGSNDDDGRVTRDDVMTEIEAAVTADETGLMKLAKGAFEGPDKEAFGDNAGSG